MESSKQVLEENSETKVPLYRSAFNSAYRNNISYSSDSYYEVDLSVSSSHNSIDKAAKERRISASSTEEAPNSETAMPTNKLTGYVGFANLPNQVYWKAAQKGFEFTLMVVGASGLGKSTLINSLFLTDIYDAATYPGPTARGKSTVSIETTRVTLKESGVRLTLTLVDTPGFGDAVDSSGCWIPIVDYIEKRYEEYFVSENKVNRKPFLDQRVHCCLYFIQPTGHGLKPLDVEVMETLSDKVNIIPVIGKADTLTPDECVTFKKQILQDIEENNIKIYKFPDIPKEDEEYKLNKSLKERVPFAVVGSNNVFEVDGKNIRGRKYSWGVINIENLDHCDFVALRKMLISTHMQDLKDTTHNIHYENYRCRKLLNVTGAGNGVMQNPLLELDEARLADKLKLEQVKKDMEEHFKQKVTEKERALKDTEKLLKMRLDVLKKSVVEDARELEKRRKEFELEKEVWERESLNAFGSIDSKKEKKRKGLF